MILCFGMSWPAAIYKARKSRTAKDKRFCSILIFYKIPL